MDFQQVVQRRRMVRRYDVNRPVPAEVIDRIDAYREAFGVPSQFMPIGAISIGYSDEPPRDLRSRRKPETETVHRGRWGQP